VDIITYSIPAFFLLIGLEWLVGRSRGMRVFRGPDVITNLLLGSAQTIFGVVAVGLLLGSYVFVYEHRLLDVSPASPLAWATLILAQDFLYYWFHRASHRMNLAWAAHAPHHQSEDFNFAVALRQGPVQPIVSRVFYLPLALFGFPPAMFLSVVAINTVYQFWIHTELVRSVGPLEWIFNTPSHHRVHHGCNGKYLDRNHAGMLIIWDRLFGTFEPEAEQPVYGTVKPVASWNGLWCSWAPFRDILETARRAPRFLDKLAVWFMPPEWRPRGLPPVDLDVPSDRPKYDAKPTRAASVYATLMFIVTLALTVLLLLQGPTTPLTTRLAFATWFALALAGLGGVLEGKRWAKPLEAARIVATPLVVLLLVRG